MERWRSVVWITKVDTRWARKRDGGVRWIEVWRGADPFLGRLWRHFVTRAYIDICTGFGLVDGLYEFFF